MYLTRWEKIQKELRLGPSQWTVTGVAGFIGSGLLLKLLQLDQYVVGVDNFWSGSRNNLEDVRRSVSEEQWQRFQLLEGDIRDSEVCRRGTSGSKYVLHQAAVGSVPRSVADPYTTHDVNVNGFFNIILAARDAKVERFVYASSSSVYGDSPSLPKREAEIGNPLSPYALSKKINEQYADIFQRSYGFSSIGLRYFNVFGPRQNPEGQYAAVIPRWIESMMTGRPCQIFGTGENSRDFCYLENIVQLNLLAATTQDARALNQIYNGGVRGRTSLNVLFHMILERLRGHFSHLAEYAPVYAQERQGDIPHSQADISKAQQLLDYSPAYKIEQGLDETVSWYLSGREI